MRACVSRWIASSLFFARLFFSTTRLNFSLQSAESLHEHMAKAVAMDMKGIVRERLEAFNARLVLGSANFKFVRSILTSHNSGAAVPLPGGSQRPAVLPTRHLCTWSVCNDLDPQICSYLFLPIFLRYTGYEARIFPDLREAVDANDLPHATEEVAKLVPLISAVCSPRHSTWLPIAPLPIISIFQTNVCLLRLDRLLRTSISHG